MAFLSLDCHFTKNNNKSDRSYSVLCQRAENRFMMSLSMAMCLVGAKHWKMYIDSNFQSEDRLKANVSFEALFLTHHTLPLLHFRYINWCVLCIPSSVYLIKWSNTTENLIEHLIHTAVIFFAYSIWWIEVTQSTILKFLSVVASKFAILSRKKNIFRQMFTQFGSHCAKQKWIIREINFLGRSIMTSDVHFLAFRYGYSSSENHIFSAFLDIHFLTENQVKGIAKAKNKNVFNVYSIIVSVFKCFPFP